MWPKSLEPNRKPGQPLWARCKQATLGTPGLRSSATVVESTMVEPLSPPPPMNHTEPPASATLPLARPICGVSAGSASTLQSSPSPIWHSMGSPADIRRHGSKMVREDPTGSESL